MKAAESTDSTAFEAAVARREARRREMTDRVPARYSGRAHWAFINLTTALGIGFCLVQVDRGPWWEWLFVPGFFVFANAFEWWIHRGPMHHPTRGMRILYERHTLQHHVFYLADDMEFRNPRELFYIVFPPLALPILLLVNLPIPLMLGRLLSENIAWLFFASVLAYYFVYEWFHFVHHLSRESWLGRRALVGWLRQHHTRHHELERMEQGNFNVSFPLWDWLLGTMLSKSASRRS
jgi:sterol desaturase/sphingolipid hydroxylase (fatty acid hydroxylase superfamily)